MGLVLWIDQNSFATTLIERVFKKKLLLFYSVSSVEDFAYLVDDLDPALIVLDSETFHSNPEAFMKQYLNSFKMQSLPFILLEPSGDFSFIKNKIGELKKPLEPFALPEMLARIFEAN